MRNLQLRAQADAAKNAGLLSSALGVNKMPGLAVSVNGKPIATISTDGLNVLNVRVHGDLIDSEFATVDVSGGLYGEGKHDQHLIWVDLKPLAAGDEIEVAFLENSTTSHRGKTIDELYPKEERPMGPWQPLEEVFHDLEKLPKVRERFNFTIIPPTGDAITSTTAPEDHSFGFSVTWVWKHPERARVSLSSNSLENIVKRTGGLDHAEFRLQFGQKVMLRVDA